MVKSDKNIEDLINTFLNDGLTAQEQVELCQLLKDPGNKAYFRKMYIIWYTGSRTMKDEDVERALQKVLYRINLSDRRMGQPSTVRHRFAFWRVAAAVLLLVAGVSSLYYILKTEPTNNHQYIASDMDEQTTPSVAVSINKVIVPFGSKTTMELPDGTVVTLNAGSCLRYASSFGENTREVNLEGEGYFKVAHNEAMSFVVKAKNVTIKALGTEFNVAAYPEEETVRTTLVKGSVSVRKGEDDADAQELILKPRQTVTIFDHTHETVIERKTEPSKGDDAAKNNVVLEESAKKTLLYTSWKDERWIIDSEPMEEFAVKLQRRYNVRIIIMDDELKRYPFNGIITDETLEQVLGIIKTAAPVTYIVNKNNVWLKIDPQQQKIFEKLMKH